MKINTKRAVSLIFSLLFVIATFPISPLSAYAMSQTDLFESVTEGYDIKLENDIMLTSTLVIPSGADITLDLYGKKLDRGLKSCVENGSVIRVEKGGKLKIKDSTGYNSGIITRGCSFNGGGIVNYGTLVFEGGTISDNLALNNGTGCGGGIYNAAGATLNLKGGIVEYNRADKGAGVYNAKDATLSIYGARYEISKGAVKYQIYDNVHIRKNNTKNIGGGIANYGTLNMKDAPVIDDNNDDDLYVDNSSRIAVTGALKDQNGSNAHIGLKTDENRTAALTSGFGANNTSATVDEYFFSNEPFMLSSNNFENELEVVLKKTNNTVVQVFEDGKLTRTEEYASPSAAWSKASSYAKEQDVKKIVSKAAEALSSGTGGSTFNPLNIELNDYLRFLRELKKAETCRVEITLGSDWEHDDELSINSKCSMLIDLNGHYIKRTRNYKQKSDGGVFYVKRGGKLTIKDSKPNSKGYDGIRGGVITGGASTNSGGAIHMGVGTIVDIQGGTIYECTTCEHGGAINMSDTSGAKYDELGLSGRMLSMKNCRIWFCQTVDSTDYCNGGGLYVDKDTNVYLNNVTIQDCYSEDSGGGIFLDNDDSSNIHMENCKLIGNTCRDNGGAICVRGTHDASYETIGAYNCSFIGNKAEESGGAVFVDGRGKEQPTHFSKCIFKNNETGDDGAAVYCNDDNVILDGCTITDNYAKDKGAVYCDSYYDVNVQGLMTVKDNDAGDSNCKDFVLQDGVASRAYVYSGGLYKGSYISISSTDSGKILLSKEMPYYQIQYFHPQSGKISYEHTKNVESKLVTASLFSEGSLTSLIIILATATVIVIISLIYKKKRGGADSYDYEE